MQKLIQIPRDPEGEEALIKPGMSSCQGCGASLSMKIALRALGKRTVVVFPACCFAVFNGIYPHSSIGVPVVHCPFASAAVTASGIAAGLDKKGESDATVMVWAGDGGTFDIGLQSLSGMAERNDDILFVCYDNEAYMNTGIQRSSATPMGAWTTTTPAEKVKEEPKKDIEQIMLAHRVNYLATASAAYPDDLHSKFKKAKEIKGTRFIHLLSSCPPGWRIDPSQSVKMMRLATQTRLFPIYEVESLQGKDKTDYGTWQLKYTINVMPDREVNIESYLTSQGRFKSMTPEMIQSAQARIDDRWQSLLRKEEASRKTAVKIESCRNTLKN